MRLSHLFRLFFLLSAYSLSAYSQAAGAELSPNILFLLTDDQRADCYAAAGNERIQTPHLDRIANRGARFKNAFATLAICSPSRAACLTGRYGSHNGVTTVGNVRLNPGESTFATALRESGYATGVTGKWHLKNAPADCGFEFVSTCWSNGTWYDLKSDKIEKSNLAFTAAHRKMRNELAGELKRQRETLKQTLDRKPSTTHIDTPVQAKPRAPVIPSEPPAVPRTDLFISGVYPHLTVYGVYSQNGAHYKSGHNECGIGAIVPWANKLWMVNYAPHQPNGSEHILASVDADLHKPLTVHPESVGGTPAGRMIHKESNQLLIAHYLIDDKGNVRVISPKQMPMRVTAIARHLKDPKNMVYYIDMEGSIWEANVHTLAVNRLFKKPVPGWHGKGGYTSQGKLVISNNGELHVGSYKDVLVGGEAKTPEERGVLAEYDGENWKVVERRQFTEVTGPHGITGGSDGDEPIWSVGWDRRSLRLKLLEDGKWSTYLLPKASYCNDASHGWYTEWPRIREITEGRWMMDMHGMFYDFPKTFSRKNSAGIKPIGSHLRYVPDFCAWNDKLILASDETSIQGNPLAGQPQTNLWFGDYNDLKTWGPASAYGGPWIDDEVAADTPSDPFLIAGFNHRLVHLTVGRKKAKSTAILRATDQQKIHSLPKELTRLPRVTVKRGDWHRAAPGFQFEVDQPVSVYLAVDQRGKPKLAAEWKPTELRIHWGENHTDTVYQQDFPAGTISIPANTTEHTKGSFGMPHTAFVLAKGDEALVVKALGSATVTAPLPTEENDKAADKTSKQNVTFTLQIDKNGDGVWTNLTTVDVADGGYVAHPLPADLNAVWLRFKTDRDCVATAFLHQTASHFRDGSLPENKALFAGLAEVGEENTHAALLYAAKRNRNLRVITSEDRYYDFTKATFEFAADEPDEKLKSLIDVVPEFTVDDASVIIEHNGHNFRLPKGNPAYDNPFKSGWPRALRELESERHLANIHGTFYELPLINNGAPPLFHLMRPVASHSKQITDFCTWNGLLVLAGVSSDAKKDNHLFTDSEGKASLWFGGIDDLWKLGKPIGHGGPWKDSTVKTGQPSDPYLMTGYDEKSFELSHGNSAPVTFTIQVDIDGNGRWVEYNQFEVKAGETVVHRFPTGYSASWVRAISGADVNATLLFTYK